MTQVLFYLLEQDQYQGHPAHFAQACQLAMQCYRQRQRCVILTDSQADAESIDELLWQWPADAFIPHNLHGEGPANGTPVEICWQNNSLSRRPVLINLATDMPANSQQFGQIYDFVPAPEALKQQARERYKQYRLAGHQLATEQAAQTKETENG